MKVAAVGFRAHSGWTALVALTLTKGAPTIVSRQRVHLVETFTYEFRQPYHTGEKLPLDEARAFVVAHAERIATPCTRCHPQTAS